MTKWIIGAVVAGMLGGHFIVPAFMAAYCGQFINIGLCLILFLVGVDMGRQGNIWKDIKEAGLKSLLIPVAVAVGTLVPAALTGLVFGKFLSLTVAETMAVSAGFGWYSLAPMLLAPYSTAVSAVAFLSNVMREVLAIVLIPLVAKHVGYVECVSLPGAAAMDTVLPVVVKSTDERIAIYSFVSGVMLTFAVPVLVPALIRL